MLPRRTLGMSGNERKLQRRVYVNSVDACIQAICRTPEMHQKVHEDYRRGKSVRRFPYAVFYEYAAGSVIVYCVFHTSRDPNKWKQRLP